MGDSIAYTLFSYILTKCDYTTGIYKTKRAVLSDILNHPPATIYSALKRLSTKYQVVTTTSNNKSTEISVLNWAKYQSQDSSSTPEQQPSNNQATTHIYKEYKNKETNTNVLVKKAPRQKELHNLPDYLINIPIEEIELLRTGTSATLQQIRSKGEDLHNWLLSKGKQAQYKDFRAMLKNALKRDYPSVASEYMPIDEAIKKGLTW